MSVELNNDNRVKSPASGLLGDEFFDAEDGGKLGFVYNISHCRAVNEFTFRRTRYLSNIAALCSISRHIWVGLLVALLEKDFGLAGETGNVN